MKVVVTLQDEVYQDADIVAKSLGISCSELCVRSLADFLKSRRSKISNQLNEVFDCQRASVDPVLAKLQSLTIGRDKW